MTPKERVDALAAELRAYSAPFSVVQARFVLDALTAAAVDAWNEGAASGYNDAVNPLRERAKNLYLEIEDAVEKAQQARDAACNAVLSWMDAEGKAGRLRYNDQCPHWQAYLDAEKKLTEAKAAPK